MSLPAPLRVGVLVSGTGTTLDALAEAAPSIGATVAVVVADRPGIRAIDVAKRHEVPAFVVPLRGRPPAEVSAALDEPLRSARVELVVLAGLRAILPSEWVRAWKGRVVNVHPSLLPHHGGVGMYGHHVYDAILAAHDLESGATVHLVTDEVDGGPVLAQDRFPLAPSETSESLQAKTQALERRLLRETVARFASGLWPLPYEPSAARADGDRRDNVPAVG